MVGICYADDRISPQDRAKLMDWKYAPDKEGYLSYKKIYDNLDYFNQLDGHVIYPGTTESSFGRIDGSVHKKGVWFG